MRTAKSTSSLSGLDWRNDDHNVDVRRFAAEGIVLHGKLVGTVDDMAAFGDYLEQHLAETGNVSLARLYI